MPVYGSDVGREVRYMVYGVEVARGTLVGMIRDEDSPGEWWAQIREVLGDGRRRTDEFPFRHVEVVR